MSSKKSNSNWQWTVDLRTSIARWKVPDVLFNPNSKPMHWNIQWCDANVVFSLFPLSIPTSLMPLFAFYVEKRVAYSNYSCPHPYEDRIEIEYGDCVQISVVNIESVLAVIIWYEDNWRLAFGLSLFDDFRLDNLGNSILLQLALSGFSSIWPWVDWSLISWSHLDRIQGFSNSWQVAVAHASIWPKYIYKSGAILCCIISCFEFALLTDFCHVLFVMHWFESLFSHLTAIQRFPISSFEGRFVGFRLGRFTPNHSSSFPFFSADLLSHFLTYFCRNTGSFLPGPFYFCGLEFYSSLNGAKFSPELQMRIQWHLVYEGNWLYREDCCLYLKRLPQEDDHRPLGDHSLGLLYEIATGNYEQ